MTLGGVYGTAMMLGALGMRVPKAGYKPAGWEPPKAEESAMISQNNVDHVTALKTPQFYLLWTAVTGNAIAGMVLMSSAKSIITDIFSASLAAVVTGAFATKSVSILGLVPMFL
jgi:hypothetical protein